MLASPSLHAPAAAGGTGIVLLPWARVRTAAVEAPRSSADVSAAMSRYAGGDESAFAIVYDGLAPRLYGYLTRQTRDTARAEDLVQQTFLQMHRARGSFVSGADVVPWAFAIARRLMIDGFRRGKREVLEDADERDEPHATDPAADDLVQAQQLATRIRRELARLPETQRVAFELVKEEGLSLAEAAEVLGTTVSAVKLRAHRAYEALRAVLGDVIDGTPAESSTEKRGGTA
jgi:RNA polymerase sigma-70 factor (ECF subfamily)